VLQHRENQNLNHFVLFVTLNIKKINYYKFVLCYEILKDITIYVIEDICFKRNA